MARIDDLKKKTKISMDEMYSCTAESKSVSTTSNTAVHTVIQQKEESYSKKVTLYLKPRLYKAFNDIYAKRMIEDRKTDKSALICEAIELLIEKERL